MENREPDADWVLEQEIKMAGASLIADGDGSVSCPNCNVKLDAALTQCPQCSANLGLPTPPDP